MRKVGLVVTTLLIATFSFAQQAINVNQVGGSPTSTAASGTQKVGVVGSAGAIFDAAQNAAAPANEVVEGCVFNTSLPTITTGNASQIQCDAKGQQLLDLNYVGGSAAVTAATGVLKVGIVGNAGAIFDGAVGASASSASANAIQIAGQFLTAPPTLTNGQMQALQLDNGGKLLVNCTGCAAASTVSLVPHTTGGVLMNHLVLAATTNATSVKASAGQLYGASIYNNANYPIYLKFSNVSAAPTCGTSTVVYELAVQAGTEREIHTEEGMAFGTGIGFCVTKGIADNDATAVAASDGVVDLNYD